MHSATPREDMATVVASPSWDGDVGARQRFELDDRFDKVLQKIRSLDNFKRFMLPPTKEEMIYVSSLGPIAIIIVTSSRCDAILIDQRATKIGREPVKLRPLPELEEKDIQNSVERLRQFGVDATMLAWLWDTAAGPILDDLKFTGPPESNDDWPHVWWIVTGQLSHLPIHAAGYHGTSCTVLNWVISSYSPSVKAMVHGRRKQIGVVTHFQDPLETNDNESLVSLSPSALLVAMDKTAGLSESANLKYAAEEVDMLATLCAEMNVQSVRPPAMRKEILKHIASCIVFHFVGHRRTDHTDPSRSCMLLQDWKEHPLTVADRRDSDLHQSSPFLGYLSACSTSVNSEDGLADEGIHLVNAFQLAGFRYVIGTL